MEEWRDIPGYEGYYQASDYGRVRSIDRYVNTAIDNVSKRLIKGKLLTPGIVSGYERIDLCKAGSVKHHFIHRLVWETFNGPIPEDMQVNHNDEVKTNNKLENLSLMTPKENVNWGTGLNRMVTNRSGKTARKKVVQYDLYGNLVRVWNSFSEINKEKGFSTGFLTACCKGKYNSAYGYIWKYAS